jgi:hypothetical protein
LDLDIFWNWQSAAIVCVPLLAAAILLGYESAIDRAILMRDMGVPIGVLGSLIGAQQMIYGIDTALFGADRIYLATGVMFLTMLYGGVFSALGFFLSGSGEPDAGKIRTRRRLLFGKVFVLTTVWGIFLFATQKKAGAFVFIQPISLTIFFVVAAIALLTGKQGRYMSNLSQGCLIGSMTSVMVGILILFSGQTVKGLLIAGAGLIYGLLGYITIYLTTYSTDESPQIAATRTNWHWIEITGFYMFMFLAPDTLLDNFQEAAVQEQIKQLELKGEVQN